MSLAERKRSRRAAEQDGRPGTSGAPNTPVFEAMEPRLLLDGGPVVINEIMYHPGTGEPGTTGYVPENLAHEYIELLNTGPTAVNLLGWELTRGVNYTFGNVTIPSGGYLVVAANVDAFLAKYPGFSGAVVGGQGAALWDGHLSNSGEDVELEDALGARVDLVAYADEGDWAVRMQGSFSNFRGWEWVTAADGGGKSLELINPALPNTVGQNWKASLTAEGTPGQPNSVAAADIAPLIVDVTHLPAIPSTTDPVAITARLIDELGTGLSATLHWRLDGAPSFQTVVMHDDGISGDGLAGDGVWGAYIPPQATNPYVTAQGSKPVVEFYVEASDSGAKTRTWPAPTGDLGQVANALYQVDNTYDPEAAWVPTDRPIYRFIMRNAEWTAWLSAMVADAHSDAQMNVTFIAIDGTDVEVRYLTGVRNRGEGTRHRTPHNYHLNIPTDTPWYGLTAVNFNSQYTQCQMAGAAIFQSAGLPAADGAAIVLLTNGTNLANTGSPQYGSYFRLESYNSEFADKHFALDPAGNLYKGVSTSSPDADLRYINDNPSSYRMSYFKETNTAADDWSDLINLVRVLNTTPDDRYTEEVSAVVNVDEWLRYFAVDLLIGNRENSLGGVGNTGHYVGDDYSLYFGIADPRAQLVIHDLDTVLGQGDYTPAATSTPEGLFPTSTIPAIARFMKWKDFAPRYYAILKDLIATTFAPENINPLLDQVLGGWAPAATIASMKQYVVDRNAHILSLIPSDLTVTSGLAQQNGYDRTTVNTVNLTGKADAAGTARILVNGIETYYSPWEGTWDTSRAVEGTTLVAPGTSSTPAVWKYDDSGTDLGTAWRSPDPGVFDDSGWAAGPAQLGYSPDEYDEATTLDYGGNPSARIPTYYFRHHFNVANPSQYSSLTLRVKRDDGIAVYLNGTPVARDNLAADAVFSTYTGAHASDDGQSWIEFTVDASLLQATGNVLAVEIHQSFADSTDISFDLQLIGNGAPATVQLKPGLNRVVVQALDATGAEIDRATRDVWYDTSATNDQSGTLAAGTTTWTAEAGPYRITGNVTVPAGATLVIEPGTTVFFNAGTYMTINGKLDAQGTEYGHIRLTVTPGSANWAGLRFSGGTQPSLISYADIEYSSGSDSIDATNTAVHLDHITWAYQGSQYYLDWHDSSLILTNSVLPAITEHELVHFWGFPANGYALIQGNWFGGTTGYNDVIDFTGGQRPGPIARIIGNVFAGGGDDVLDLDATDAYVAGNVFMHIHQDGARESKSYAVTTGTEILGDIAYTSNVTVVGNLFYDVDHALLAKDGGFITAINNTIVGVHAVHADATSAVISFYENRSGQWPGAGAYLEGNLIYDAGSLFENLNSLGTHTALTFNYNLIPEGMTAPGVGNIAADPRLWNTTNVTDPWTDFRLRPGSPALGAGPNGADMGALAGYLATLAGAPVGTTYLTGATLTVGGPDLYGYKYRVMKDGAWLGAWSAEVPVTWAVPELTVSSLVRSGTTATATVAGHGFSNGDTVVIEGVSSSQRAYMGPFTIFSVTANTFSYTVAESPSSPATAATGSRPITCWKVRPAPAVPAIQLTGLAAGTYTVYVVKKDSAGFWQSEAEATASGTWTVDPAFRHLRINEVLADNVAAHVNGGLYPDVVELYYDAPAGSGPLSLTGLSLTDNRDLPTKFTFGAGAQIQPGQYLVLYADSNLAAPGIHLGFSLKAEGDDLYLFGGGPDPLDSVRWGFQLPDLSIGRRADGTWGLAQPTFGAANVLRRTGDASTLKINEWFTDGDVLFVNDYIEIYNPDPLPVDMGGLHLSDNPALPGFHEIVPLSFVAGTAMRVFTADADTSQGADHVNFKLSPYQGLVGLYDADERRIDQVYYGPQTTDVSFGRTPDGEGTLEYFVLPTPGVENPQPWTGPISEVLVPEGAGGVIHVPTAGEDPLAWTQPGYNDQSWLTQVAEGQAGLVITEAATGDTDGLEIQNVSDGPINTTGWFVAVNNGSGGNINSVNATVWYLPASVGAAEVLYRTDNVADQYWGADIDWDAAGSGWVMIVDSGGSVVDFVAWGYTEAEIASLSINVGSFSGVTVGDQWTGDGADFVPTPGPQEDVFAFGATWNYLHPTNGVDPATSDADFNTTWMQPTGYNGPAFDRSGPGILGYDTIDYGPLGTNIEKPASGNRYTAYFRRQFTLTTDMVNAGFEILSDDGAFIYIDGVLVARNNILTGADTYFKLADGSSYPNGNNTERFTRTYTVGALSAGTHLIAVSVHNASPSSSTDLGFALRLFGQPLTEASEILARTGDRDASAATDFEAVPDAGLGTQNPGLTVPFGTITPVTMGLGFSDGHFDPYVATGVSSLMLDTTASLWTRITFQASDLTSFDTLTLRVRYDDGFIAYLNGVKVYERNAPASPAWDSQATGEHPDAQAVDFEAFDISAHLGDLFVGENVLAIHGLNLGAADADFLLSATLEASLTEGLYVNVSPSILAMLDSLRITEIMYNPLNSSDYEYIEFQNVGARDLDLTGFRIRGGVDFTFDPATTLLPDSTIGPGEYFVVVNDVASFQARYGTGKPVAGEFSGKLDNDGEELIVRLPNPYDAAVLRFTYKDSWYTPQAGRSLVILDPTGRRNSWGDRDAWRLSSALNGSPGADDPTPQYPIGTIVITEVLAHTDGSVGDWIEIYNTTDDAVPIGGWYLSDDATDLMKYQIAPDTVLEGKHYLTFNQAQHFGLGAPDSGALVPFGLSELGDQAYLSTASGAAAGFPHDAVEFGASDREVTFGRYTNSVGDVQVVALSSPTMGYLNADPKVGPAVITEIMYHPKTGVAEFIELHNTTGEVLKLYYVDGTGQEFPAITWQFHGGIGSPAEPYALPAGASIPAYGYALVVPIDPATFRATYGISASVPIWGPYDPPWALANDGETIDLLKPGAPEPPSPEHPEGFVPYILVDRIRYGDSSPWPTTPDGGGASLERLVPDAFGNDVANWTASTRDGGTPGWENGTLPAAPQVTGIELNDRAGRSASAIEPSGIGVRFIDVTFSGDVIFDASAVTLRKVTFSGTTEVLGDVLAPLSVTGSGTSAMRIEFTVATVVDTWVKVVLNADGVTAAGAGTLLDGEPRLNSSGLGYIYKAADDLPTGDGTPGGNAVFYVGNLRGDMQGGTFSAQTPEGRITVWDINGFTIKFLAGNLDADMWGGTFMASTPDGVLTPWDINGFTIIYRAAVAAGRHLDTLPTGTGMLAVGGPAPLVLSQEAETPAPAVEPEPVLAAAVEMEPVPAVVVESESVPAAATGETATVLATELATEEMAADTVTETATELAAETLTQPAAETPVAAEVDVLSLVGEIPPSAAASAASASAEEAAPDLASPLAVAPEESFEAMLTLDSDDLTPAPEAWAPGASGSASAPPSSDAVVEDLLSVPALSVALGA